jgi:hypothetical protein
VFTPPLVHGGEINAFRCELTGVRIAHHTVHRDAWPLRAAYECLVCCQLARSSVAEIFIDPSSRRWPSSPQSRAHRVKADAVRAVNCERRRLTVHAHGREEYHQCAPRQHIGINPKNAPRYTMVGRNRGYWARRQPLLIASNRSTRAGRAELRCYAAALIWRYFPPMTDYGWTPFHRKTRRNPENRWPFRGENDTTATARIGRRAAEAERKRRHSNLADVASIAARGNAR